jgi:hypothetical protein
MHMFGKSLAVAALVAGLGLTSQAHANLIISANGTQEASDPTNTFATFSGGVGGFNINVVTATGVNAFANNGKILDVGSLNVSTSGTGSLTLLITETNLTSSSGSTLFGSFTAQELQGLDVTRSFYLDTTNSGSLTTLLGTTTSENGSFSLTTPLSGPYSITEEIVLTATAGGGNLSSDDSVSVPEPMSLALLGSGVFGLGMIRRRRNG